MKIALAQINSTVGDIKGNTQKIIKYIKTARRHQIDLVVFPELAICGYPPKDLLLKTDFLNAIDDGLEQIISETEKITVIVGTVISSKNKIKPINYDVSMSAHFPGYKLYNAAALIKNRRYLGAQAKTYLPNYDIFDEQRYFSPATKSTIFKLASKKIGITICEDIWRDNKIISQLKKKRADFIINISSSPFYIGKYNIRQSLLQKRAVVNQLPIFYCNLVGGQDDLIFDGGSLVYNRQGKPIANAKRFEEDFIVVDTDKISDTEHVPKQTTEKEVAEVYSALLLGLKDYVNKNGFNKVILGLSGGVDSALVACLAVAALGQARVELVIMPGPFTKESSIKDALEICQNLKIKPILIPINEIYEAYLRTLQNEFRGLPFNTTEENIQARIRGNILMALSNKFGYLVLTTGNKSELSVGYSTLYGDMAGGLAAIADVPKIMVYQLCEYINEIGINDNTNIIPKSIFTKPPSAELRPNQTDQDDLPPYEILDKIIHLYVEENRSKEEITKLGFSQKLVDNIISRIDHNEYKRHQAPLGLKITPKAFGFGRRMPITNAFK
ncbi:MAG: NAD+ synthase [candidate division WOR-3 bacterium]